MKRLILYFCAVFSCYFTASAQSQTGNLPAISMRPVLPIAQQVTDSMPNAYNNKDYTFIKKRNNGNGFDLYESSVDHMMVVKPDNSFHDQMGNRQQYEFVTPDFQKPEQFPNKPEKINQYNHQIPFINPFLLKKTGTLFLSFITTKKRIIKTNGFSLQ